MNTTSSVYLAIPYAGCEEWSAKTANKITADLMIQGIHVFSPISHTHMIAQEHNLPGDWKFWESIDKRWIETMDEIWVVASDMDKVKKSTGVQAEIQYAKSLGKLVRMLKSTSTTYYHLIG